MNDKKNFKNIIQNVKTIQNLLIFDVKNKIEQLMVEKNERCLKKHEKNKDINECLTKNNKLLKTLTNEFVEKFNSINKQYLKCIENSENCGEIKKCSKKLKKDSQKEILIYLNNIDFKNY